jgi:protein-S-isoprenylcysteine O-methyltransferase Ste14
VRPFIDYLHPILWLALIIYWKAAALHIKPPARRDSPARSWVYFVPTLAAVACFWLPAWFPALRASLFQRPAAPYLIGTCLLVAGLLIAVWARVILGRNWSNVVTVKVDHELIQTGPYRWMRHPIYTGLLLALAGSALAQNLRIDLAVLPLAFLGFWIKLRREEDWMHQQFGAAYETYCARTSRLVPFLF